MNEAIQLLDQDKVRADIFFDQELIVTDWDDVRRQVVEGKITKASALAHLRSYEPMTETDPREHAHWISQQKLRLVLLREAKKPLETKETCRRCGARKSDPYEYHHGCLHCAERNRQLPSFGSRGSCEFVRPAYNVRSLSWGILYYWDKDQDSTPVMFWLADFFKSREEAETALLPVRRYNDWLERKYNNLISYHRDFSDVFPISVVMQLKLPMSPEELREFIRSTIQNDMDKEHEMMGYIVRDAVDDHESDDRD